MILLDTDHLTVAMDERDARHSSLRVRLLATAEQVTCSIVSVEETLRGWLAAIHRLKDVHRQLPVYARLERLFAILGDWRIVSFDESAADEFALLRRRRIRIGAMDLKIAAIALVHDAVLLTSNLRDFSQIPGIAV